MNHISTPTITHATNEDLSHLETCEKCRSRLTTDVDLGSVRARILSEATTEPRSVEPRKRATTRPWLIGVTAAAAVLVLFLPILFTGGDSPADPVVSPGEETPGTVTPAAGETKSFEMTYESADGVFGRLIWSHPDRFEALRATQGSDGVALDYAFFATDSSWGYDPENVDPFPRTVDGQVERGSLPDDSPIPWQILLDRMSPDEMWDQIGGDGQPVEVEPTHPLASSAYADGGLRLEWSEEDIPVLVASPAIGEFRISDLIWRDIGPDEVGNNVDLPFHYALYLADSTTPEQRSVISDGVVTFSDYQAAVAVTARCADADVVDTGTGLFSFEEATDLDNCRRQHLEDIEKIWRVDSQNIPQEELTALWAMIDGRTAEAEIYQAEPGPERTLASGDGWSISIWQRGPGICHRHSNQTPDGGGTGGHGCVHPDDFPIPHVLNPNFAMAVEDSQPLYGEIIGIVTAEADRLVVTFESGDVIEVEPQDTAYLGYRGFGIPWYDATRLGDPVSIEVFDGDTSLGISSHKPVRELDR